MNQSSMFDVTKLKKDTDDESNNINANRRKNTQKLSGTKHKKKSRIARILKFFRRKKSPTQIEENIKPVESQSKTKFIIDPTKGRNLTSDEIDDILSNFSYLDDDEYLIAETLKHVYEKILGETIISRDSDSFIVFKKQFLNTIKETIYDNMFELHEPKTYTKQIKIINNNSSMDNLKVKKNIENRYYNNKTTIVSNDEYCSDSNCSNCNNKSDQESDYNSDYEKYFINPDYLSADFSSSADSMAWYKDNFRASDVSTSV